MASPSVYEDRTAHSSRILCRVSVDINIRKVILIHVGLNEGHAAFDNIFFNYELY